MREGSPILDAIKNSSDQAKKQEITEVLHTAGAQPPNYLASAIGPASIVVINLVGGILFYKYVYTRLLRRIPTARDIPQAFMRTRSLFGRVTSVGDGDNFRLYHTPGGLFTGWGWIPFSFRRVPVERKALKDQTVHVRIAGVDAPELPHFGKPGQPFGQEALDWLKAYVGGRKVRVWVYKLDQYQRVVGTVYMWKGLIKRDVGLEMIRAGFATVYEAKSGAEFGDGLESKYRDAEAKAKRWRKGMWIGRGWIGKGTYESPRDFKTRTGIGTDVNIDTAKK